MKERTMRKPNWMIAAFLSVWTGVTETRGAGAVIPGGWSVYSGHLLIANTPTGRVSIQAFGFPDDSTLIVASRFFDDNDRNLMNLKFLLTLTAMLPAPPAGLNAGEKADLCPELLGTTSQTRLQLAEGRRRPGRLGGQGRSPAFRHERRRPLFL